MKVTQQWYVVKTVEKNGVDMTKEVITTNNYKTAKSCLDGSKVLMGLFHFGDSAPMETNYARLNPLKTVAPQTKPVARRPNRRNYDRSVA